MASTPEEKGQAFLRLPPPGYRFKPNDSELLDYYLKRKVYNEPLPQNVIREVQLYNYDPETLIAGINNNKLSNGAELEDEWYFFTPRDRKYKNGSRPDRGAGNGFWKATGADKRIKCQKGNLIGFKKTLVFLRGKPPRGEKTNWIMHEYVLSHPPARERTSNDDMRLDDWVLCRVYKKHRGLKCTRSETPNQNTDQKQEEAEAALIQAHTETQKQENGIPPPQYDQQIQVQHLNMLPRELFYSNASSKYYSFGQPPDLPEDFGSFPDLDSTIFFQQAAADRLFIPIAVPFSSMSPDHFQLQQQQRQFPGSSNSFQFLDNEQFCNIDEEFSLDDFKD